MHFLEPPVRVDPQAVVGWSDCLQSSEVVRESDALVREMESQLGLLGSTSLRHLQTRIQQRLGQQRR